jgi:hypothetical protein
MSIRPKSMVSKSGTPSLLAAPQIPPYCDGIKAMTSEQFTQYWIKTNKELERKREKQ